MKVAGILVMLLFASIAESAPHGANAIVSRAEVQQEVRDVRPKALDFEAQALAKGCKRIVYVGRSCTKNSTCGDGGGCFRATRTCAISEPMRRGTCGIVVLGNPEQVISILGPSE